MTKWLTAPAIFNESSEGWERPGGCRSSLPGHGRNRRRTLQEVRSAGSSRELPARSFTPEKGMPMDSAGMMPLKPGARPARALPVGAQRHLSEPRRNNGWVALSVLPNGDEKRWRSRAGRAGPRIPTESIWLSAAPGRSSDRSARISDTAEPDREMPREAGLDQAHRPGWRRRASCADVGQIPG